MKTLAMVLMLSGLSFAGVAKFSAKHVVKPAAKTSAKVLVKSAKVGAKSVKLAAKVAY